MNISTEDHSIAQDQAITMVRQDTQVAFDDTQHPFARYLRHRLFTVYRRLFSLVFGANLAIFIWISVQNHSPSAPSAAWLSTPIAANLFVAVLFRTDDFINFLYTSILWIPLSLPLSFRRRLAKIYEFGGVHSGTAVGATFWNVLFTVQVTRASMVDERITVPIVTVTWIILSMLLVILVMAHPTLRAAYHDAFEHAHRFCGWAAVVLYWVLNILLTAAISSERDSAALAYALFTSPTIYFLIAITLLLILPWARLRRVEVFATQTSSHATRLYFQSLKAHPTQTIRISTSPLTEWHSFATIPSGEPYVSSTFDAEDASNISVSSTRNSSSLTLAAPPKAFQKLAMSINNGSGMTLVTTQNPSHNRFSPCEASSFSCPDSGFSVLVSAAGDWTKATISNPSKTCKLWFRGRPTTGVTKAALLFKSAVIVTTGSGIGPALSLVMLLKARSKANGKDFSSAEQASDLEKGSKDRNSYRLVWSTPEPLKTYGSRLLAEIRDADPEAVIWDTRAQGRPDLTKLALGIYHGNDQRCDAAEEKMGAESRGSAFEAVFVVSNQRVTEEVVYRLERRGVPAYGPVFDS